MPSDQQRAEETRRCRTLHSPLPSFPAGETGSLGPAKRQHSRGGHTGVHHRHSETSHTICQGYGSILASGLTEVTPIYRRRDETDNRTWFIRFIFLEAARWSTCLVFKTSSHYVLQAGLELMVLLPRNAGMYRKEDTTACGMAQGWDKKAREHSSSKQLSSGSPGRPQAGF